MLKFYLTTYNGEGQEIEVHRLKPHLGRRSLAYPPRRIASTINKQMGCKPKDIREVHVTGLDSENISLNLNTFINADLIHFGEGLNIRKVLFVKYSPTKITGLSNVRGLKYVQFSPYTTIKGFEEMIRRESPVEFNFSFDVSFPLLT